MFFSGLTVYHCSTGIIRSKMEKICIVKRRQQYVQPEVKLPQPEKNDTPPQAVIGSDAIEKNITPPENLPEKDNITPDEIVVSSTVTESRSVLADKKMMEEFVESFTMKNHIELSDQKTTDDAVEDAEFPDKKIVEELVNNDSSVISIMMTTEQSELLKQSEYIKELLSGTKSDPSFDIKLTQDGQLAINFRFNDSLMLRMLAPNQVCQMLQVSRSFLQKLVHENKIKSYKLGRMRRFLLEDILEYLSNDSPFAQFSNEQ
jgi:excisionase family DNA binding protein